MMDITIFTDGKGGQGELSVHKNEKITRTVPILNQISNNFYFDFFFYDGYLKFSCLGGGGREWIFLAESFFFSIISSMQ